jgi:type IV pilus assembly protein PilC
MKAQQLIRAFEEDDKDWRMSVRVPGRLVVMFTRHLAVMLHGGVPLVDCLECLKKQDDALNFGVVVSDMARSVSEGHRLSQSVKLYPKVFSSLYSSMMAVGEETGQMTKALDQLADWMERDEDIRQRLKSALTYPCIVFVAAVLITLGLFYFVVPQFMGIFASLGSSLPLITRVVLFVSELIRNPGGWLLGVVGILAAWYSVSELWSTRNGRERMTTVIMMIPWVGDIYRTASLARFSTAAEMSLRSGTNLLSTLALAGSASQNALIAADVEQMVVSVSEGVSLSGHMDARPDLYDSLLIQTIQAGEESATIDQSFGHAATFYEDETRYLIEGVSAAIEPIMLLGVGSLVGVLLLSVFLPMYSYIGNL